MKCSNCGAELVEGAKFCGNCGTPVVEEAVPVVETAPVQEATPQPEVKAATPQAQEYVQQMKAMEQTTTAAPSIKKSIWSLILGIAGLGSSWTGFLGPFGLIGIIISIIGLIIGGKAKKENPGNKMGKSGWVLALIGLILSAIFTIIGTIIWVTAFREGVVYFK
ncbi:MAG: zinc ribbon domain-containing protein [Lachnospiraceae bacterium]|nr:zinc ribbon domain-containing protein [Lachnospiraceae bacterium]